MDVLPDIPKLYTALAEWLACIVYIIILKKRVGNMRLVLICAAGLILQTVLNLAAGYMHPHFWLGWMASAFLGMYLLILVCGRLSALEAGFFAIRAFIAAEFAASLQWQLNVFLVESGWGGGAVSVISLIIIYSAIFGVIFKMEQKPLRHRMHFQIGLKELWISALTGCAFFFMSNLSFVYQNTPFSGSMPQEISYIRTLLDFIGIVLLHSQLKQIYETVLRRELENMDSLFRRQYEQYQASKENDEIIKRVYHDLKHQLAVIRKEKDAAKQSTYLKDIDIAVSHYESQNKTGNSVLDTVLSAKGPYCAQHDINFTCIADGSLLDFMEVMDLCSIFGNALDNAFEHVSKLPAEKRLVTMSVTAQNDFVVAGFDNYCEDTLELDDGLPVTTKADADSHGYGMKSIRKIAGKYNGTVTFRVEHNWFCLRILFPLQVMQ